MNRRQTLPLALAALGMSLFAACGSSTDEHNAVLAELQATQAELQTCQAESSNLAAALRGQIDERNQALSSCETALNESQAQVLAFAAENQRRDEIYRQMVDELQDMISAGQLEVRIDNGRLVLDLPTEVLFDSGQASLNVQGRGALGQIATVLNRFPEREFQVEGHTDDVPISNSRFDSNWELSTARALTVVNLLVESGVAPERLSAAGYGEFEPNASNATDAGRAQNRRVEIVMVPDLGRLRDFQASSQS
jgi:chemotaxis protein MotB